MARVSFANKKVQDAKEYANQALTLKPDYVDALVMLSQIAKNENNNADALLYAEKALLSAPSDQGLIQYVDSLKNLNSRVPPPDAEKQQ
jgi:tetratricopeptide (TPR) repeat protein